jgi:poly-gamma-glutamate synthesis protein (capsule biosynthesis protein)
MTTLFLSGDVMTGRGIDQALPHPGNPELHEPSIVHASEYVNLAEAASGPLPHPIGVEYLWGDALEVLQHEKPQARIINLETAITRSDTHWSSKDVHYKMNPENIACLTVAGISCCALANNHTLDWGIPGLLDTLDALDNADIKYVGAGRNLEEARRPAVIEVGENNRVIVFSLGSISSGIPTEWAAGPDGPGVYVIECQQDDPVRILAKQISALKRNSDSVIVSIHWGGNWGYNVPRGQKRLAHALIDTAGVDVVHGHSSHHVKAIEVYRESLILYGCGDFLNDYEGIGGYESFRGDLGLMYFVAMDPASGRFRGLKMLPTQIRRFRLNRASPPDSKWLQELLNREGRRFNTTVKRSTENTLTLLWN